MQVLQLYVIQLQIGAHFVRHRVHIQQIAGAHGSARHFVFIRRTDAAAGRADFFVAFGGFARLVEGNVVRQNQRCGGGNVQPLFHVRHACRHQFVDFTEQGFGGNYHAGTDEAV